MASYNGTNGITYPDATTTTAAADFSYFYWDELELSGGLICKEGTSLSGDDGVYVPSNDFLAETAPARIRSSFASTNGTTDYTINVPTGVSENDTIFLYLLYENDTVNRPTIPGFTIIEGINQTFATVGSAATVVFLQGSISAGQTTITIPNDATFNGGNAALVALFGEQQIVVGQNLIEVTAATARPGLGTGGRRTTVFMGLADNGPTPATDTPVSFPTDPNLDYTDPFVDPSALVGRGGFIGAAYETNANSSFTIHPVTNSGGIGGVIYYEFVVDRVQQ